jgi:hypothetical protein
VRLCVDGDRQCASVAQRYIQDAVREGLDDSDPYCMRPRQIEGLEYPRRLACSPRRGDDEPALDALEGRQSSVDASDEVHARP